MKFLELAKSRYSVRKYSSRGIEPKALEAVLEAARLAPTGCNFQPQRLLYIDDPKVLEAVGTSTKFLFGAPAAIIVCYETEASWKNLEGKYIGITDASIVATHIILAAAEQGLGTCWVGCFDKKALVKALNIPAKYEPLAILPIGYPADDSAPSPMHDKRKPVEEFVWKNHF